MTDEEWHVFADSLTPFRRALAELHYGRWPATSRHTIQELARIYKVPSSRIHTLINKIYGDAKSFLTRFRHESKRPKVPGELRAMALAILEGDIAAAYACLDYLSDYFQTHGHLHDPDRLFRSLLHHVGRRIRNTLRDNGVTTMATLLSLTQNELLSFRNLGHTSFYKIIAFLNEHKLSLAQSPGKVSDP